MYHRVLIRTLPDTEQRERRQKVVSGVQVAPIASIGTIRLDVWRDSYAFSFFSLISNNLSELG